MGRYGNLDYPKMTKVGFGTGALVFLLAVVGEWAWTTYYGPLPAWEVTLLWDVEVLAILLMVFSPFVFAILLPLTE